MGFYDDRVLPHFINAAMNNKHLRDIRARVCGDLKGDVVEIGFGTGHNLPFLPAGVATVRTVNGSRSTTPRRMRCCARGASARSPIRSLP
jgi:hypothetical protein